MQREILATLDEVKATPMRYGGGDAMPPIGEPGRVSLMGYSLDLPDGVYDLRASVQFLAKRHGASHKHADPFGEGGRSQYKLEIVYEEFRISCYRAARSLIQRGPFQWCCPYTGVPKAEPDKGEEGRFVCRAEPAGDS